MWKFRFVSTRAVFSFALAGSTGLVHAATSAQIDEARGKALAWLYLSHRGDGSWGANDALRVHSTAAVLEAMRNAGIQSGQAYSAGVAWLANAETPSIDATARKIAALSQAGLDTSKWAQALIDSRPLSGRKSWGSYPLYELTVPDTVLGLSALRLSAYKYTAEISELGNSIYCDLLPAQRPDGGWPFAVLRGVAPTASQGESSVISTALAVRELKAMQVATGWDTNTCGASYSVGAALTNAVAWLNVQRHADNGIGGKGVSTPLETALAYSAIQAVNPTHAALIPAQDYLLTGVGKPGANGSWGNDPFVTALVLKTLPASTLVDTDKDGIPDAVEMAMNNGNSTTVADGRTLATGNGQAQPGLSTSLFATTAYLDMPFNLSLQGTAPFTRVSGQLPPGLTLSSLGQIGGTPIQLGDFNFVYANAAGQTIAAISVVTQGTPGDINGDGEIDVADIALLQRHIFGLADLSTGEAALADLAPAEQPDGVLDVADLQRLIRLSLELE